MLIVTILIALAAMEIREISAASHLPVLSERLTAITNSTRPEFMAAMEAVTEAWFAPEETTYGGYEFTGVHLIRAQPLEAVSYLIESFHYSLAIKLPHAAYIITEMKTPEGVSHTNLTIEATDILLIVEYSHWSCRVDMRAVLVPSPATRIKSSSIGESTARVIDSKAAFENYLLGASGQVSFALGLQILHSCQAMTPREFVDLLLFHFPLNFGPLAL